MFHGNQETQAVYFSAGSNANGPLAYIRDIDNNDVRTEGMSYGMMIAVQMDKKPDFDALWNWAKTYMGHDQPDHPARGYFSWSVKIDGTPNDEMPAPDGEEYFATALYFAGGRWGNGVGIYNYRAQADRLLVDMRHREEITGATVHGSITAGSIFDRKRAMVRFTPAAPNADHTDPSYHLPAFYEVWARWGPPQDREFWKQAATNSRAFFRRAANTSTGLTPEYANFDGSPWAAPWKADSVDFYADAWRTAMNWSVDWSWWRADEHQPELSDRLQAFFDSQGLAKYGNHYSLDGRALGTDHSTGLVGTNAVASLAATKPLAKKFTEELWKAQIPTGQYRYYDGMLYLLSLLHVSGEFRIWPPLDTTTK